MKLKYSILLSVASGLIGAFAFPMMIGGVMLPNMGFLAWLAFVPLFIAIRDEGLRKIFLLTFLAFLVFHSISLYWLYNALVQFGKLAPVVAILVLSLLMIMQASFFAVALTWAKGISNKTDIPLFVLVPLAFVATGFLRAYFPFGGFPWNNIAYTQSGYPLLIQTADFLSVYGVTFLIIIVNWFISDLIHGLQSGQKFGLLSRFIVVALLTIFTFAYGWYRLETVEVRPVGADYARVAIVQGNIPQDEKWDSELINANIAVYSNYMKTIKESQVDLSIWPESSYPYILPMSVGSLKPEHLGLNPAKKGASWLLFGALSSDNGGDTLYNSAILTDNKGNIAGRYHKVHLVPFGEYVPFRNLLFFVSKLVAPVGEFKQGTGFRPLVIGNGVTIAPMICYEDVFPDISRTFTKNGADILITLTNDAWYGWTSAAQQHLHISVFRSVENRRYMLRAANTGISAVIGPTGNIDLASDLFQRSFMLSNVPVLKTQTLYNKVGDVFAYLCLGLLLLLSLIIYIRGTLKK